MPSKAKVNWDSIPVVIEHDDEPNLGNPHAVSTPEDREKVLRDMARTILLRRAKKIASN
jgi:hypothetical protein